ncbi:hypothetical protein OUZ56_029653 [Daphnia magna]|uniref:Uncharacterized protein n=1 Tax=Daphnia magna TaxID=35525 RepID=A0ABR0B7V8_9CRUS|nr:hypothetical protein OUZ56_029653 [Daphnia magna]
MNGDRGLNEELEFHLNDLDKMNNDLTSSDDDEIRRERRIEAVTPIHRRLERKLNGRKSLTPMQQLLAALN